MAKANDTSRERHNNSQNIFKETIEIQRAKVLQAHAIMICLREALLYTEGNDSEVYAEAANAAALLADEAAQGLDSVNLQAGG